MYFVRLDGVLGKTFDRLMQEGVQTAFGLRSAKTYPPGSWGCTM